MGNKLAIITICYNDRKGLESTFASLRAQSDRHFDLIIVDGGSTDGSVDLIQQNLDLVTQWESGPDGGIYDAQNKGWRMAKTPFVLFLNSGDVLVDPFVIKQALPLIDTEVDIAYGDVQLSGSGRLLGIKKHPGTITTAWLMKEVVAHQAQFIRRELLERLHGYDKNYRIVADYAFFARAFWEGGTVFRKLDMVVGVFDLGGISSAKANKGEVAKERRSIQLRYAPRAWYLLYHTYAAINRILGR